MSQTRFSPDTPDTPVPAPAKPVGVNSRLVVAVLVVVIALSSVVLAWRYAALMDAPPTTYYEFQLQRWEYQLQASPDDPAIWATLGGLHAQIGDTRRAARAFSEALRLDPKNPAALMHYVDLDIASGRIDEARARLEKVIESLPIGSRYLPYFKLGELERDAGRPQQAIRAFQASVKDDGTFWNAHFETALLFEQEGRLDEALREALLAARFASEEVEVMQTIELLRSRGATATVLESGMPSSSEGTR